MSNEEFERIVNDILNNPAYREKLTREQVEQIVREETAEAEPLEFTDTAEEAKKSKVEFFLKSEGDGRQTAGDPCDASYPGEYMLYLSMGDALFKMNCDQAYLCYENAAFLCPDPEVRKEIIKKQDECRAFEGFSVKKVSIVIVSFNQKELTKDCLESVEKHCAPGSYETVIVDNGSSDGSAEWLKTSGYDMKLCLSDGNRGFAGGCNTGISCADPDNDIFLLNNDTRMLHNSLFFLRMALYSEWYTGAVGAVSNYGSNDTVTGPLVAGIEEYAAYGTGINIPHKAPCEEKSILSAFALLVRRQAMDMTGGFDEDFFPGYFDDNDLCLRLRLCGWRLKLVHNSYIYHAGSRSFRQFDWHSIGERNHRRFIAKHGYDDVLWQGIGDREQKVFDRLAAEAPDVFRLAQIGAGTGDFLSRIKYAFPAAFVVGTERNRKAVEYSLDSVTVLLQDYDAGLPFTEGSFDYIICHDREERGISRNMYESALGKYLSPGGKLIVTGEDYDV